MSSLHAAHARSPGLQTERYILSSRKRLWHLSYCAIKCRRPQWQAYLQFMTVLLCLEHNLTISNPLSLVVMFICTDWCCRAFTRSPAVPVNPSVYKAVENEDTSSTASVEDRIEAWRHLCGWRTLWTGPLWPAEFCGACGILFTSALGCDSS